MKGRTKGEDKQSQEEGQDIEDLLGRLDAKNKEAEDNLTRLKYLQADFENYKKQIDKEKGEFVKFATAPLVTRLIDVMENLERALGSADEKTKKGIEMIYKDLRKALEDEGLKEIPAVGETCDPYKHEVLMCETRKDCEDDIIIEELQRGYTFKDRVLRCSKVKVAKRGD